MKKYDYRPMFSDDRRRVYGYQIFELQHQRNAICECFDLEVAERIVVALNALLVPPVPYQTNFGASA